MPTPATALKQQRRHSAARPPDLAPRPARRTRHAGRAAGQRTLRARPLRALAHKTLGVHRDAPLPRFAGRTLQSLGSPPRKPARAADARCSSTAAAPSTTSPTSRADGRRAARAQRVPRRDPAPGLLRVAAAVQRPVRRCAQASARAGPRARARRARRRRHRRARDELHADAQARGARDPEPRRRPRPQARQRGHLRHLRAAARAASPRRAQHRPATDRRDGRLPRPVPAAGPLHRQAGARAAAR